MFPMFAAQIGHNPLKREFPVTDTWKLSFFFSR